MTENINLERLEPRLKEFYEVRADELSDDVPALTIRLEKAIEIASPVHGERILDIGAMQGRLGSLMSRAGLEVNYTGFDVSDTNVDEARKAGFEFVQGSVLQPLPFPDNCFDCIFVLELLEHLTAPVALLAEIHRILTDDPSGRVVVSVPSPYNWVEFARELLGRQDPEGHLAAFTSPVMANIAALAGFSLDGRWGTSIRIANRQIPNNSLFARSRIYRLRKSKTVVFAGKRFSWS